MHTAASEDRAAITGDFDAGSGIVANGAALEEADASLGNQHSPNTASLYDRSTDNGVGIVSDPQPGSGMTHDLAVLN